MERKRRERRNLPPFICLSDAVDIAAGIHNKAGGIANADGLALILDNPTSSSTFLRKIAALRSWGLITKEGNHFRLSAPAEAIVSPRDEAEKKRALLDCFLNVGELKQIAQWYAGKTLPEGQFFLSGLTRDIGLDSATVTEWADTFRKSGETAGIFIDLRGRKQVRQNFQEVEMGQLDIPRDICPPPPLDMNRERSGNEDQMQQDCNQIKMGLVHFTGPRDAENNQEDIRAFHGWFKTVYRKVLEPEQA